MKVIGRDSEIHVLSDILSSNDPEFLALYGRRRVGKTYLIRHFFSQKNCIFFNVTGTKEGSHADQIKHFTHRLVEVFSPGITPAIPNNWSDAFRLLHTMINQINKQKKIVIFIDELPWMAKPKSKLLETIDYYWNQYWSFDARIKLIVCGSSASWIIKKIVHNQGGLHNRITKQMHLKPLTLNQTKYFLKQKGVSLNHRQLLHLFYVLGGIPFYLNKVRKGLSVIQIIESLTLSSESFLANEFDKLFSSLFDGAKDYITIVKLLASSRSGISERTLLEKAGGHLVGSRGKKILNDLEQTGFIMSFIPIGQKYGKYYRLIDEYVLFYLKWIEPIKSEIMKNALQSGYFEALSITPEWLSWQGYAFEAVCYKHIPEIKKALKLSPTALSGTWRYVPRKNSNQRGAQIDLLFDRRDDAISICEIKHSHQKYHLTKDYLEALHRKLDVFKLKTKTSKTLFLVLICSSGVKNNSYVENEISQTISLDDFFQ